MELKEKVTGTFRSRLWAMFAFMTGMNWGPELCPGVSEDLLVQSKKGGF